MVELEELERGNPSKEDAKSRHNVTTKTPKKDHAIKTQVEGVLTEKLTEEELQAKLQGDVEDKPISLRDAPQYFKDYTVNEVVIVMP